MIKKFFSYYRPHKKLFAFDLCCSLSFAVLSMLYPLFVQAIMAEFKVDKSLSFLLIGGGILLAIFIVCSALVFIIQYWGHILGIRIQGDMRSQLFAHLQTLPFNYFDENKTGSIMSRVVTDLFEVAELAHHGPEDTFISLITITGVLGLLFSFEWRLALPLLFIIILMVIFALFRRKKMRNSFKAAREKISEINAEIESSISGIRVAKAYTASSKEIEKFETTNTNFKNARQTAYKNMGIYFSGMGFFNRILYFTAIIGGGLLLYFDVFDNDIYAVFLMYIAVLLNPVSALVNLSEQIQDGMTGFVRFQEILAVKPEVEPENPVQIDTFKGDIEFRNVSFSYKNKDNPANSRVIKDLTLSVQAGKTIAFVGPSGGGKTTLCHLIPRFYEVDSGEICIDGVDITTMKRHDLRRNIGIVAQDVFLFAGSIKDNIAYGRLGATDEEIYQAARQANIHDFAAALPNGYDTQVGERGVKLSGGQKQRISIARAFLKNPPILILDEATSALDNVTEMQIQSSLEQLSQGRTTIVVAHRLSTIKNCDEIFVLTGDGIAERGTHSQLVEKNGVYAHLYSFYG